MEDKILDRKLEPMPKEVNFRNLDVLVNYLEEEYNKKYTNNIDIEKILNYDIHDKKPYLIRDLNFFNIRKVKYEDSNNTNYWGSNEFFIKLYDKIEKESINQNIAYDIGKYVIHSKSTLDNFLGHFLGVENTIKKASQMMNQWNDTKKVSLEKINNTHYRIKLLHKPHVIVNDFALDYHKGVFESLGEFSGAREVSVAYSLLKENDYVFDFSWKKKPLLKRVYSFFLKNNKYVSSLIEQNRKLSKEKSNLEKKIDYMYDLITEETKLKIESDMKDDMMSLALDILSEKSEYTGSHSKRVAEYSKIIYDSLDNSFQQELLKEDKNFKRNLYYAGLLHDLGKISVPDSILEKPYDLTNEEFEIIKKHPIILKNRISKYQSLEKVAEYAYSHHEREDGLGYPNNLTSDKIPIGSKILAVADTYDALTSHRPYRKAMDHYSALEIMKDAKLDQGIVKYFEKIPESKLNEIKYLVY
ncbi:MAG: HD-GYP domain-containing protein [Candidatus Woesearchaeota archaeon]